MGARVAGQAPGSAAESAADTGPTPAFEVATVKPSLSGSPATNFGVAPGRFSVENATVVDLIRFAYNVKTDGGIAGAPAWTTPERFDVAGKIAEAESETIEKLDPSQRIEQYRLMMQSLLAERFGLKMTTQTRELPVYALVVARGGPKLSEPGTQRAPQLWGGSRGELHASSVSMALFADWISGSADAGGRSVIDETGLKGSFDFTLKWTKTESAANMMEASGSAAPNQIEQTGPSLFTALEEQLGLKLEPAKGPVKVIVIERVQRPTPN
jgi:uncharacterized protein (TIGR03435 family)